LFVKTQDFFQKAENCNKIQKKDKGFKNFKFSKVFKKFQTLSLLYPLTRFTSMAEGVCTSVLLFFIENCPKTHFPVNQLTIYKVNSKVQIKG